MTAPVTITARDKAAHSVWFLFAALFAIGVSWGMTMPLTKLAVSTGHAPLGIIPWQFLIVGLVLGVVAWLRRIAVPWTAEAVRYYLAIALIGTILPNSFSYWSAANLPAGIMSIVIATVPMFSLVIGIPLQTERFEWRRVLGLALGATALILIALPETSLPDRGKVIFVLIALIAPLCYGFEGNYIARFGAPGVHPVAVLLGASVLGFAAMAPAAIFMGVAISPLKPWGIAEWGILGTSLFHAVAYVGYVWLVGAAGVVFTAQVAYVVTASGVILSGFLLGESYAGWVWAALLLMLLGIALVQPRPTDPIASDRGPTNTAL